MTMWNWLARHLVNTEDWTYHSEQREKKTCAAACRATQVTAKATREQEEAGHRIEALEKMGTVSIGRISRRAGQC